MRNNRRTASLLLASILIFGLLPPAGAADQETAAGEPSQAIVLFAEEADGEKTAQALAALPGVELLCRYDTLLNGAAVEGEASALAAALSLPGVVSVLPSRTYHVESDSDGLPPTEPRPGADTTCLELMNAGGMMERGYTGDGMVIAVIDSGLMWKHEAFAENELMQSPALSWEDIADFERKGGSPGKYLSARVPFAYDYCNGDDDVTGGDDHGTHVAALAAGYSLRPDSGEVVFRGAAPAAQILAMKVFPDNAALGATDEDVLRALEDAYALGADVINLSLGADNGFSSDGPLNGVYRSVFKKLREAGVVICCASGNAASAVSANGLGSVLPTADYTDYGTISSPASFPEATAIAAATLPDDGSSALNNYRNVYFLPAVSEEERELPALSDLTPQSYEYVMVGGLGEKQDYEGLDLTGKVAVVSRGVTYFTDKVRQAAAAGAVACIIYNNEPGYINAIVEDEAIPAAVITQEDGAYLTKLAGTGRGRLWIGGNVSFFIALLDQSVEARAKRWESMALASSAWGTTTDLRLAPQLTAPGGRAISAGGNTATSYVRYSGTSMAAGNASGAYAVVLQALRERGVERKQEAALATALLESTAYLLTDREGVPLSPRQQGTGMMDVAAAIDSPAVLSTPILEGVSSPFGRLTLRFTVRNLTGEPLTYTLSPVVLTDSYVLDDGGTARTALRSRDITEYCRVTEEKRVAVPAGGEAEVELELALDYEFRKEWSKVFTNGFYLEGYVKLQGADDSQLHASFLGYCGDWAAAPVLETVDFRDVQDMRAQLAENPDREPGYEEEIALRDLLPLNLGANLARFSTSPGEKDLLLGENRHRIAPHDDRNNYVPTADAGTLYPLGTGLDIELYTLRNAARVIAVLYDRATREIYSVHDGTWVSKSVVSSLTGVAGTKLAVRFDGRDGRGEPLPGGKELEFAVYAWREGDEGLDRISNRPVVPDQPEQYGWLFTAGADNLAWHFSFRLDGEAPQAEFSRKPEAVEITVTDNARLAYVLLRDPEGNVLCEEAFLDGEDRYTITVPVTEDMPERLYLAMEDYATNTAGWELDLTALLSGEEAEPEACTAALVTDAPPGSWYHDGLEFVLEEKLLLGEDPFTFRPEEGTVRAGMLSALWQVEGGLLWEEGWEEMPFTDMLRTDQNWLGANWAYNKGLISGYDRTTLGAYTLLTREEMAIILYRLAGKPEEVDTTALDEFTDVSEADKWARTALAWVLESGAMRPREGLLAPQEELSRAEAACVLLWVSERN